MADPSEYCKQQTLGALLQELEALAAKAVIAPMMIARHTSAGVAVPHPGPGSVPPQIETSASYQQLFIVPGLMTGQEAAAADAFMATEEAADLADVDMPAASTVNAVPAARAVQESLVSAPFDVAQYNLDDFEPQAQHKLDSVDPDSDGSGTDDLETATTLMAATEGFKQAVSKSSTSGSNKRQRQPSPDAAFTSRKEPKNVFFEYAKQQWETELEFMLPNGQTWVDVAVKGDPSRSERGIVYCKLCRHYAMSNKFGRGHRGGKRTALRQHMETKDHRELVKALQEGWIAMPTSDPAMPTAEQPAALQQHDKAAVPADPAAAAAVTADPTAQPEAADVAVDLLDTDDTQPGSSDAAAAAAAAATDQTLGASADSMDVNESVDNANPTSSANGSTGAAAAAAAGSVKGRKYGAKRAAALKCRGYTSSGPGPTSNGKSPFRGVFRNHKTSRWLSQVGFKNRKMFLGYFDEPAEAARAYDVKVVQLLGARAKTNFPLEDYLNCSRAVEAQQQEQQKVSQPQFISRPRRVRHGKKYGSESDSEAQLDPAEATADEPITAAADQPLGVGADSMDVYNNADGAKPTSSAGRSTGTAAAAAAGSVKGSKYGANCAATLLRQGYTNSVPGPTSSGKSPFRGVCWDRWNRRWRSQVGYKKVKIFLGNFHEPAEAARAYDKKLVQLHGAQAKTNFPLEDYLDDSRALKAPQQKQQKVSQPQFISRPRRLCHGKKYGSDSEAQLDPAEAIADEPITAAAAAAASTQRQPGSSASPELTRARNASAGVAVPHPGPGSVPPQIETTASYQQLFIVPGLMTGQEAAAADAFMATEETAEFAAVDMPAALTMKAVPAARAVQESLMSAPVDFEQYNIDDFVPKAQHKSDSGTPDNDGSGTVDLKGDTTLVAAAKGFKQAVSKSATSGSSKRQSLEGRDPSPYSSRKEPRKAYFEYAKQQRETDEEFMLPNGQNRVDVAVKGDPSRSERGVVYCKLCRHYDKNNIFGRGYRGGKRTALREHMETKDHRELVKALQEGRIAMPTSDPAALQQHDKAAVPADPAAAAAAVTADPTAQPEAADVAVDLLDTDDTQPGSSDDAAAADVAVDLLDTDDAHPGSSDDAAAADQTLGAGADSTDVDNSADDANPTSSAGGSTGAAAAAAAAGSVKGSKYGAKRGAAFKSQGHTNTVPGPTGGGKSGFRGVFWDRKNSRWRAQVGFKYRKIYLGYFDEAAEAARAYDEKVVQLLGIQDAGVSSETLRMAVASLTGGNGPSGAASPR